MATEIQQIASQLDTLLAQDAVARTTRQMLAEDELSAIIARLDQLA